MAASATSKNDSDALLCANNCGFYGNSKNRNLCSVCYAAFLREAIIRSENQICDEEENQICVEEPNLRPNFRTRRSDHSASQSSETSELVADLKNNPTPKTKNRCKLCKKKVGLLGFNCRCGGSFCGKHRYPEEHSCNFDHMATGREILAKQLVECKADKLEFRD